jgi:uncharacterized membrane protein
MRLRKTLRLIASAALVVVVSPVIGEFFVELARELGLYSKPSATLNWIMGAVDALINNPIYPWIAGGALGLFLGVMADAFARRTDSLRPVKNSENIVLANELVSLSEGIDNYLQNPFLYSPNVPTIFSEMDIILHKMSRLGYATPSVKNSNTDEILSLYNSYFKTVVPYIRNDFIDRAKKIGSHFS